MTNRAIDRIPELLAAYRETGNVAEAAAKVRMCRKRAIRFLREFEGAIPRSGVWQRRLPVLLKMVKAGESHDSIARHFNISRQATSQAIKRYVECNFSKANSTPMPDAHQVVGRVGDDPEDVAAKVARYVRNTGAGVLIRSRRGAIAVAIPGTRVSRAAEAEGCIVATYATESRDGRYSVGADDLARYIAEDVRGACDAGAR